MKKLIRNVNIEWLTIDVGGGSSSGNGNSSSRLVNDKSGPWWSRLFPPKVSHRRQIVQKLIDDVGQRNPRNPSASSAHPVRSFDHSSTPSSSELDSGHSFISFPFLHSIYVTAIVLFLNLNIHFYLTQKLEEKLELTHNNSMNSGHFNHEF